MGLERIREICNPDSLRLKASHGVLLVSLSKSLNKINRAIHISARVVKALSF